MKTFKTEVKMKNEEDLNLLRKSFDMRRFAWNYLLYNYFEYNGEKNINELSNDLFIDIIEKNKKIWLLSTNLSIIKTTAKELSEKVDIYESHKEENRYIQYRPYFHKKKNSNNNSYIEYDDMDLFEIENPNTIKLKVSQFNYLEISMETVEPILFIKMLKNRNELNSIKINETNNKVYIEFRYVNKKEVKGDHSGMVGIDLGIKHPLSCYDNNGDLFYYEYPESLISQDNKIRSIENNLKLINNSKSVINKNKLISNYEELLKNANIKGDIIKKKYREEVSIELCKKYKIIKLEKFVIKESNKKGVRENIKNRENSLLGKNCGEFLKTLKNIAVNYDSKIFVIPKNKPTTQTCSECGYRKKGDKKMGISDKMFICDKCGARIPRDLNAAKNIYNYGEDSNNNNIK